jgi:hypothetical protein
MFVSPMVWEFFLTVADYIGSKICLGSFIILVLFLLHCYIANFCCIHQYATLVQPI